MEIESALIVDENIYRNEDFIFYDDESLLQEEIINDYEGGIDLWVKDN